MRGKGKLAACLAGAVVASLLTGCAVALVAGGAAAGAGAVAWYQGALRTTLGKPMASVREATVLSLQKSGNGVVSDQGDVTSAEIKTVLSDGSDVVVRLKSASSTATEVSVRIGTMGDRARSQAILDDIAKRAGIATP